MSTTSPSARAAAVNWPFLWASLAFGALLYFAFAIVRLHVLRPDLDPTRRFISQYAVGPHGHIMALAFLSLGVASAAMALGLIRVGPRSVPGRVGLAVLGLFSIGTCVAAFFPMDVPGAPPTRTGTIHVVDAQFNFVTAFVSSLCLALGFRRDERWRGFFPLALTLSLGILVSFVVFFAVVNFGSRYGLANRIMAAFIYAWLVATTLRLRSVARESGGA